MRDPAAAGSRHADSVWPALWRWGLYVVCFAVVSGLILIDAIRPVPAISLFPIGALTITFGVTREGYGTRRPAWIMWFRLVNYVVGFLAAFLGACSTAMASDHSGQVAYILLALFYGSLVFMAVETLMQPVVDSGDNL